ncbi:Glycoside hydrolase family 35 [Penicillium robsamsonii]|uniref:Glycoside hydrolase family 35 n=1 Tax=Penicillium robsamsonii TaxID=1792511 RepID=UPI002548ADBF|nr:Glycoside hydrolase family 35 [Penicillium robsamsonii]KAJ5812920.1 Glycoside hydrolase family 35 [Penicillium robsamsonii]
MERSISRFLLLVFGLLSVARAADPFTYDNDTFILNGEPYLLRGGQMDPQHIPHELWPDRLEKARGMGLNTIFSYVFWDQLEPKQGEWDNTGNNDIAKYFRLAKEKGLNVILRPGPYVCAEHEWGGFPAWLSEIPGMVVRDNNKPFLDASKAFIDRLAKEVGDLQVTNGGPILMVQIENEYGSYGSDHVYLNALKDIFTAAFDVPFYTNDGGTEAMLKGGQISGVLAETDGDVYEGFAARDKYVTDPTSLGPQLDGEYYITWLDQWASNYVHKSNVGNKEAIDKITTDVKWLLNNNGSFNLFMFHGGTNWGFQNGADWADALQPITTSYDYGAPLDETGRRTDIYLEIRKTIGAIVGEDTLPALPDEEPLIEIPSVKLTPSVDIFDSLPDAIEKEFPVNMEAVGQATGLILYRHVVTTPVKGAIKTGDKPRDRILVYVNKKRVGVIDGTYKTPNTVNLDLKESDVLDVLVENLGRVNFGGEIVDQRKGIVGNVTVGESVLSKWAIYPLPLATPPKATGETTLKPSATSGPVFFTGTFDLDKVGDTFLELPDWTKGVVWVNGVNLGRYWIVGPQQSLYLPWCYLRKGENEITVLALEPTGTDSAVRGVTSRTWGNNPDPDAP